MAEKGKPAIKVFQIHQEAFSFLGNDNIISEHADFGQIWGDFFKKGGYTPIIPYATDKSPINIWHTGSSGETIYSQGLFVKNVETVPNGYTLAAFPAADFLVVTTDWMETSEEAVGENGNGQCNRYAETVPIPEGYVRENGANGAISLVEKEHLDTPEGSRYEVWVPIRKA